MNGAGNKGMFSHVWTESQHDFPSDLESYLFLVPSICATLSQGLRWGKPI